MSKPSKPILSSAQRQQTAQRVAYFVAVAERAMAISLPPYDIRFDIRGSAWGYFQRRSSERLLRFNPQLFALHFDASLDDTVPHEVAHMVVDCIAPRRARPHGREWQAMMLLFGIERPRITHSLDLTALDIRRQSRHGYLCACREYELTQTRHNRIQQGTRYTCRHCGEALQPKPCQHV